MITYFNSFAENWMAYFGTAILQNTLFLGVIFLVLHVLRDRDARIRYAVAALGLIKLLVPPFVPLTIKNAANAIPVVGAIDVGNMSVITTETVSTKPVLSVISILFLIWIVTLLFMLVSTLGSTLRLKWHLRDSSFIKHVEIDEKEVDIYCSPNISVPLSIGLFPKRVYVPEIWSSLTKELQHSLLRHEVAHIKRKDGLLGALQILARAIYYFHPLVWILTRQADELREMACDDMAVDNSEVTPLIYSRCLVHVAEHMLPSWSCSSASTLMKQKNKLYHRVNYQVKETDMKKLPKHRSRLIWTLLLVLIVPLSWYCKQADATVGVNDGKTGKIYGKVIDAKTGEALAGVNIILYGTPQGAATNMNGEYFITNVKPGKHTVSASRIGYVNEIDKNIVVLNNTSRELNFELISQAIQGEKIIISANESKSNPAKPLKKNPIPASVLNSGEVQATTVYPPEGVVEAPPAPPAPPLPPTPRPSTNGDINVEYIAYDVPPTPIGGETAISRNIKYPENAKKAGIEGQVVVQAFINENGVVEHCQILRGVPGTGLDEAAINAIKMTKFNPAKQQDKNVGVWISIPVRFKLKKSVENEKFVPYDTPPEPIGGMEAIAENLVYPKEAKQANEQGTVIIQAKIDVNGNVETTKILRSFGSKICDEAASKAIMLTKWTPAKQRDKDVSVWITVPIEFKLDNNK